MTALGAFHVLPVADVAAATAFWRDAIGCGERFALPTFAEVSAGDAVICLRRSRQPGQRTGLGVDVADLDATCERVAASGGAVDVAPADGPVPGLRLAMVADPDGNTFQLTEHRTPPT